VIPARRIPNPDGLARVHAEMGRHLTWLLRWRWSDHPSSYVECCPGDDPRASLLVWS
jgi:hypothetical protein